MDGQGDDVKRAVQQSGLAVKGKSDHRRRMGSFSSLDPDMGIYIHNPPLNQDPCPGGCPAVVTPFVYCPGTQGRFKLDPPI